MQSSPASQRFFVAQVLNCRIRLSAFDSRRHTVRLQIEGIGHHRRGN